MSLIYGRLGISEVEADRVLVTTVGKDILYDAVTAYTARVNADVTMAESLFVQAATENFQERYKLPGGGYMEEIGLDDRPAAAKAAGSWDVAYPLKNFGRGLASNDVTYAYMTVAEFNRHVLAAGNAYANTRRRELLRAILRNTSYTFSDPINGSLTVQCLANGDSVVYPPVLGSDSEATDNHYLGANYLATAISNTNDPYQTIADELTEHFGVSTGGSNILVLINPAETPETLAMTDVTPVATRDIAYGDSTDLSTAGPLPATMSARVIGTHEGTGVAIAEWAWMPAGYMVGVHLDAERPLKERVDPANTGLPRGFTMVAQGEEWPHITWFWRARFGFGVANRLNGVVMHVTNSSSYTVPSAYA